MTGSHPIHPIAVPDQPQGWAPRERDWVFTFGSNHRAFSAGSDRAIAVGAEGFPLKDRYVVIRGTYEEARARMHQVFGMVWSSMYESKQAAGVDEYGLTELVIT